MKTPDRRTTTFAALLMTGSVLAALWWATSAASPASPQAPVPDTTVDTPSLDPRVLSPSVDLLARRLEHPTVSDPAATPEQWALLARSYQAIGRQGEAERAYGRAAELAPRDARLLAERAEAVLVAGGPGARDRAAVLLAQALAIEPLQAKALALSLGPAFSAPPQR